MKALSDNAYFKKGVSYLMKGVKLCLCEMYECKIDSAKQEAKVIELSEEIKAKLDYFCSNHLKTSPKLDRDSLDPKKRKKELGGELEDRLEKLQADLRLAHRKNRRLMVANKRIKKRLRTRRTALDAQSRDQNLENFERKFKKIEEKINLKFSELKQDLRERELEISQKRDLVDQSQLNHSQHGVNLILAKVDESIQKVENAQKEQLKHLTRIEERSMKLGDDLQKVPRQVNDSLQFQDSLKTGFSQLGITLQAKIKHVTQLVKSEVRGVRNNLKSTDQKISSITAQNPDFQNEVKLKLEGIENLLKDKISQINTGKGLDGAETEVHKSEVKSEVQTVELEPKKARQALQVNEFQNLKLLFDELEKSLRNSIKEENRKLTEKIQKSESAARTSFDQLHAEIERNYEQGEALQPILSELQKVAKEEPKQENESWGRDLEVIKEHCESLITKLEEKTQKTISGEDEIKQVCLQIEKILRKNSTDSPRNENQPAEKPSLPIPELKKLPIKIQDLQRDVTGLKSNLESHSTNLTTFLNSVKNSQENAEKTFEGILQKWLQRAESIEEKQSGVVSKIEEVSSSVEQVPAQVKQGLKLKWIMELQCSKLGDHLVQKMEGIAEARAAESRKTQNALESLLAKVDEGLVLSKKMSDDCSQLSPEMKKLIEKAPKPAEKDSTEKRISPDLPKMLKPEFSELKKSLKTELVEAVDDLLKTQLATLNADLKRDLSQTSQSNRELEEALAKANAGLKDEIVKITDDLNDEFSKVIDRLKPQFSLEQFKDCMKGEFSELNKNELKPQLAELSATVKNKMESLDEGIQDQFSAQNQILKTQFLELTKSLKPELSQQNQDLEDLKNGLEKLNTGLQPQLSKWNEELKGELSKLNGTLQPQLSELSKDLKEKLSGLSDKKINQQFNLLHNTLKLQLSAQNQKLKDQLSEIRKELKPELRQLGEDLKTQFSELNKTLKAQVSGTSETLESKLKLLGEDLKGQFSGLSKGLKPQLSELSQNFKELEDGLGKLRTGMEPQFEKLRTGIEPQFEKMSEALKANISGMAKSFEQHLVQVKKGLKLNFSEVNKVLENQSSKVREDLKPEFSELKKSIQPQISQLGKQLKEKLFKLNKSIEGQLQQQTQELETQLSKLGKDFKPQPQISKPQPHLSKLNQTIKNQLSELNKSIKDQFSHQTEGIKKQLSEQTKGIKTQFSEEKESIKKQFSEQTKGIKTQFSEQTEDIKKQFSGQTEDIKTQFSEQTESIKTQFSDQAQSLKPQFFELGKSLKPLKSEVSQQTQDIKGLKDAIEKLNTTLEPGFSRLNEDLKTELSSLNEKLEPLLSDLKETLRADFSELTESLIPELAQLNENIVEKGEGVASFATSVKTQSQIGFGAISLKLDEKFENVQKLLEELKKEKPSEEENLLISSKDFIEFSKKLSQQIFEIDSEVKQSVSLAGELNSELSKIKGKLESEFPKINDDIKPKLLKMDENLAVVIENIATMSKRVAEKDDHDQQDDLALKPLIEKFEDLLAKMDIATKEEYAAIDKQLQSIPATILKAVEKIPSQVKIELDLAESLQELHIKLEENLSDKSIDLSTAAQSVQKPEYPGIDSILSKLEKCLEGVQSIAESYSKSSPDINQLHNTFNNRMNQVFAKVRDNLKFSKTLYQGFLQLKESLEKDNESPETFKENQKAMLEALKDQVKQCALNTQSIIEQCTSIFKMIQTQFEKVMSAVNQPNQLNFDIESIFADSKKLNKLLLEVPVVKEIQFRVAQLHNFSLKKLETTKIEKLEVKVTHIRSWKADKLIGGNPTLLAIKNHTSYMIATSKSAIKVVENNETVYSSELPIKTGFLYDMIYVEDMNCYFIHHDQKLYKKGVNKQHPQFCMNVYCEPNYGNCLLYSKLNKRLIVNNYGSTINVINLQRNDVEIEMGADLGHQISNFCLFGTQEKRLVSITWKGFVLLQELDFEKKQGRLLDHSVLELKKDRDEHGTSIAVYQHFMLVDIAQIVSKNICSRKIVFKVVNDKLVKQVTLDQLALNINREVSHECFGVVGRHIMWVGLSGRKGGKIQVYDFDVEKRELRELKVKREYHMEEEPNRLCRLGDHFYYTGSQGNVMRLSMGV